MYNLIVSFFVMVCIVPAHAQDSDSVYLFCYFKGNGDGLHYAYSHDGYLWQPMFNDSIILKPNVSKDRLFRDPSIARDRNGIYHMVWTVSWNDKGIGYASSKDLMHWSSQKFIPVMMHEDSARNTWAPEITSDARKKRFMIYWATTINGRFPQKDTAAESDYNHRIYFVTTKKFKKFSKTKLLYDPGFSVIDAAIVIDRNRYVMFLKNETRSPVEKNIRIAYGTSLNGFYSAASAPITGNYWAEGPAPLKVGEKWIVYFDKYRDHSYGAVESTDLVNWKDVSDKVSFSKGVRHGTAFIISGKEFEQMQIQHAKATQNHK